jgi:hypothetical protein
MLRNEGESGACMTKLVDERQQRRNYCHERDDPQVSTHFRIASPEPGL